MQRVDEDTVVTDWLALEQEKGVVDPGVDVTALSPAERYELLRGLWSPPRWGPDTPSYEWYRTELTESMLRSAGHAWGGYGVPGTVMDLARAIDRDDPGPEWRAVLAEHDDLVAAIELIADELPRRPDGPLVLVSRPDGGLRVVDGNHRATALALHLLRTGEFVPLETYVGFQAGDRLPSIVGRVRALRFSIRHR